jgi:hypothetical protein
VVGIPDAYQSKSIEGNKFEIPLWQLELVGGKGAAKKRAAEFSEYARLYAETMQDGLPIRDAPDNNARRVYRLRMGQIIKVLTKTEGNPAISATGEPLPGDWYQVLTEDGAVGYCFSYRLKLFEHAEGALTVTQSVAEKPEDTELEMVFSKEWYPEWYGAMVSSRRIDPEELAKRWCFVPGQDLGIAHMYLPGLDRSFTYTGIQRVGNQSWRFEGAPLQMSLRSDTTLAVQYTENGGVLRTVLFVTLPMDLEDLIVQELERRNALFQNLYSLGPVLKSTNYGNLSLTREGKFTWTGNSNLIPQIIPASALGSGSVLMGLFLDPSLENRYDGAFTLRFDSINGSDVRAHFMYTADDQGLRIEHVPPENLEGVNITRRSASPMVIYFFKEDRLPAPRIQSAPSREY